MIVSTSELAKELINRKLLIFKRNKVDVKEIKNIFRWWEKYDSMFPIMIFFACQILRIMGSQIEIEIILKDVVYNHKI
jgi:hypothetical protein